MYVTGPIEFFLYFFGYIITFSVTARLSGCRPGGWGYFAFVLLSLYLAAMSTNLSH